MFWLKLGCWTGLVSSPCGAHTGDNMKEPGVEHRYMHRLVFVSTVCSSQCSFSFTGINVLISCGSHLPDYAIQFFSASLSFLLPPLLDTNQKDEFNLF